MGYLNRHDLCMLSDRGIKQAIEQGLLKFTPVLEDRQIQPASIDLLLEKVDNSFPFYGEWQKKYTPNTILKKSSIRLLTTQEIKFCNGLYPILELRSSLRRLSCYVGLNGRLTAFSNIFIEIINPSEIDIVLNPGDKIAQLLVNFYDIGKPRKDAVWADPEFGKNYPLIRELEHGTYVSSTQKAKKLMSEEYFKIEDAEFLKGNLLIHAGNKAKVLRKEITVDFSKTKEISNCFEDVNLPYRLMPNEHLVVETRENLELSEHIGIHFYDNLFGSLRARKISHSDRVSADIHLINLPDGWIDPGYKGTFSRQPKTYYEKGVMIKPNDVLGYGYMFYFPNAVERVYGAKELGSHYQNSKETKLTQN